MNKVTIPKEKSPKVAITSNGLISGVGTSYKRRQHIVTFGNYWNRCSEENENVSDPKHLGKMLFDQFTNEDWNDFYNFGFRCVQEYLQDGLSDSVSDNIQDRLTVIAIEGSEGTGEVTEWMEKWLKTTRLENNYNTENGISEDELFNQFCKDNPLLQPHLPRGWSRYRFHQSFYELVTITDGYYYNEHRAKNGDGKDKRKWLCGNPQKRHIRVTSDFDVRPLEVVVDVEKDEIDTMAYFERLAS